MERGREGEKQRGDRTRQPAVIYSTKTRMHCFICPPPPSTTYVSLQKKVNYFRKPNGRDVIRKGLCCFKNVTMSSSCMMKHEG